MAIPWGPIISAVGQAGSAYLSKNQGSSGGGSVVSGVPGTSVSTGPVSQSVSLNTGGADPGLYQSPSYSSRSLSGYSAVGWPGGFDDYQDAEWSLEGSNWIPIAIAGVLVVGVIVAIRLIR